ncbi:MAG TPA: sugar phosphate nucleotidyltransferase [Solirubrobacterales bacterium]|nr:sugar phosphate nucleotidyltransferase [Solirubrobacterales bacterium]
MTVYGVIAAGGAGTRLWPRSRRATPKHLLALGLTGKPLVRETYERVRPLVDQVVVLTETAQVKKLREVLPELHKGDFIVEPVARGTTSAYGLAALTLQERDPDAILACFPADHVVTRPAAFRQAVRSAVKVARAADAIVLVGLEPEHPATGLGYIKAGEHVRAAGVSAYRVERFVEKPDLERARSYLAEGTYYWNLAMFTFRAAVLAQELKAHAPAHHRGLRRVLRGETGAYAHLPTEAIDYAVMERTDRLLLVPARFGWIDVGAWPELTGVRRPDREGNLVEGPAVVLDSHNNLFLTGERLVAAIGVEDLVVVEGPDSLLICPRSRAQEVKRVVAELGRRGLSRYL